MKNIARMSFEYQNYLSLQLGTRAAWIDFMPLSCVSAVNCCHLDLFGHLHCIDTVGWVTKEGHPACEIL